LLKLSHSHNSFNEEALKFLSQLAPATIVAWGNHGAKSDRPRSLHGVLSNPKGLGHTKKGEPRHPRYVASTTRLVPWHGIAAALQHDGLTQFAAQA